MNAYYILGIHAKNRMVNAKAVQELLTEYGCSIRTRVGLHRVSDGICAADGVILLELFGETVLCEELYEKLSALDGVDVQKMIFPY